MKKIRLPPIASMPGSASSIGPGSLISALAPSSCARAIAFGASSTRIAMAQTLGPCWSRKSLGKPLPSPFRMKLIPPWRNRVTFLERCMATAREAQRLEHPGQRRDVGSGELDELEAAGPHRVEGLVGHHVSSWNALIHMGLL